MQWGWKIFGAFLGLIFMGPIGLIVGVFIGHLLDMGLFTNFLRNQAYHRFNPGSNQNDAFFQSIFPLMGYLAKSDGRVSEAEVAVAKKIMGNMSLNATLQARAVQLFNNGKEAGFSPNLCIERLRQRYRQQPTVLRLCHDVLQQVARADGLSVHPQKAATLNQLAQALGAMPFNFNFQDFDFGQFGDRFRQQQHSYSNYSRAAPQATHANPYKILGINSTATNAEIKKSYRRLMSKYHPDKLASKNLPKEEIAKATEKTQEIKSAYEQLRRNRGF
jgi:DnaJ like chaperone protein